MTQKTYIVEGRHFRTQADYNRAVHDQEIIDRLRKECGRCTKQELEQLKKDVHNGKYRFLTVLGRDFEDELEEKIRSFSEVRDKGGRAGKRSANQKKSTQKKSQNAKNMGLANAEMDAIVQEELRNREKRRRLTIVLCCVLAIGCLGYFGVYSYDNYKVNSANEKLSELKNKPVINREDSEPVIHYTLDGEPEPREVLDEYKNLLNKNKKLIGWVKIDDTNIDYPVFQTSDNEYYLDHNMNQEYDRNGSIFMDKDCDVLKPSTNFILYGHHMKSGQMFGKLNLYEKESYFQDHQYIQFDTIYEKGTYQVMYVFRSRVYSEQDIVFKYYQFIDALSEQEFTSNMQEMANMSLYDTGVTAQYGDQLLTLSTCDYQEQDGRFVVVAKKVAAKE